MVMRLFIVRHGETVENVNQIVQGQIPGKLTKKGIEQTRRLGERLKNEKIDVLYSSDLRRAADTAKEILKYHRDIPVFYTPLLRERSFGKYEGKPSSEWKKFYEERGLERWMAKTEGGENYRDLKKRIGVFLDEIVPKHLNDTVVLVTHGGVIRCLYSIFMGKPLSETAYMKVDNTALCVVDVQKNHKWRLEKINSVEHLE